MTAPVPPVPASPEEPTTEPERNYVALCAAVGVLGSGVLALLWGLTSLSGVFARHGWWWAVLLDAAAILGLAVATICVCIRELVKEDDIVQAVSLRGRTRRAALVAALAHKGQVDKIGEPYIGHPSRVAEAVCGAVGDGDAVQAAFLHDVVEDTDLTLDDLRTLGFSGDVVTAVMALTKVKGESFAAYYERVKANPIALVVKWFDVADNADPRRLSKVAPDTQERLRDKYERAKELLRSVSAPVGGGQRDNTE